MKISGQHELMLRDFRVDIFMQQASGLIGQRRIHGFITFFFENRGNFEFANLHWGLLVGLIKDLKDCYGQDATCHRLAGYRYCRNGVSR